MRRPRAGRFFFPAILGLALALLTSACGGSATSSNTIGATSGAPEKSHIVVGTLPIPDAAPLFLAIHNGYFKQAGLTVTPEIVQTSPQSTPKLLAGTMDFSLLNYAATFQIEATSPVKFRLVADSTQGAPGVFEILVPRGSKIASPADLKGMKIAAPATNGIPALSIASAVRPYGLTLGQLKIVPMPFPDMLAAMKTGQVDAAYVTAPFNTQIESVLGARVLADTMTGPMANFPISGWGTVQQYVQKYPKTVAAFQRAIDKAQQMVATDRRLVEQILPTYTKITPQIASVMAIGTYPTTLSAARLQRVVDLMVQFGFLQSKLDVAPMIVPPPKA